MTNHLHIRTACLEMGHAEPISVEPDFVVWLGADDDRTYLTATQQKAVEVKAKELAAADDKAATAQAAAKKSAYKKLAALGLTADEIAAL